MTEPAHRPAQWKGEAMAMFQPIYICRGCGGELTDAIRLAPEGGRARWQCPTCGIVDCNGAFEKGYPDGRKFRAGWASSTKRTRAGLRINSNPRGY